MDAVEIEAPELASADEAGTGSLVELIVAACDESEDLWEIGDRVDALVESGRLQPGAFA